MQYHLEAPLYLFLTRTIHYRRDGKNVDSIATKLQMGSRSLQLLPLRDREERDLIATMAAMVIHPRKTNLRDWKNSSKNMKWEKYPGLTGWIN